MTKDNTALYIGDDQGWIYVYDLAGHAASWQGPEAVDPTAAARVAFVDTTDTRPATRAESGEVPTRPATSARSRPETAAVHANLPTFGEGPRLVSHWRAHLSTITALVIVEDANVSAEPRLTSASLDKRSRLWTTHGEFIGTFGQDMAWQLDQPETWEVSDSF